MVNIVRRSNYAGMNGIANHSQRGSFVFISSGTAMEGPPIGHVKGCMEVNKVGHQLAPEGSPANGISQPGGGMMF